MASISYRRRGGEREEVVGWGFEVVEISSLARFEAENGRASWMVLFRIWLAAKGEDCCEGLSFGLRERDAG